MDGDTQLLDLLWIPHCCRCFIYSIGTGQDLDEMFRRIFESGGDRESRQGKGNGGGLKKGADYTIRYNTRLIVVCLALLVRRRDLRSTYSCQIL